uniref:Uncharacterized protein n=1 Tax=Candidatus Kentrum sp. FM TaxID=2126340 RepID=A0A450TBB4_9GAMM|nr:MAG: hypothetical protein BECKFM1743C_GA0114222_103586 [Candidatus Kentron sp. FM]VFJ66308.1 MAG: hypothetical protein BECKFM1743A_GA0114220_104082 [Candidatus Kentron sp. FM]VFK09744.1 MAG: hypothetical protein BECKFM1743B_GA0114221_101143 [Candidatus Kentron sp. FM]
MDSEKVAHEVKPIQCSPEELICLKDDPIVEEIRAHRSAHAARYGNDLDRIFAAIKESEKEYGGRLVNREHNSAENVKWPRFKTSAKE